MTATVRHLRSVPTTEPFVTRRQLAATMGISLSTLDKMVAEGMPSTTWGRRTRRFRASEAIEWAKGRDAA